MALDWTLDLVFAKDLVQFLTLRAPSVSHVEHEPVRPAAPPLQESEPVLQESHR